MPGADAATGPVALPPRASGRGARFAWQQILALHLDARRNWRALNASLGEPSLAAPNEVDVFLIGLLARFAGGKVLADDAELVRRLEHVRTDPDIAIAISGAGSLPDGVVLFPLREHDRAGQLALSSPETVVLVHGAGRDWQPSVAGVAAGLVSRPLAGLSPAMWKSSLTLLAPADRTTARDRLLADVLQLLADRTLDPFFLLDEVQDLRAAARRPETVPDDAGQLKARIAELEHEVANLRRLGVVQQETIARLGSIATDS